jgi:hypothetical protein
MTDLHPDAPVIVRRLGPGVYRAECLEPVLPEDRPCGWSGPVREGPWWDARPAAEADADAHAGRTRPVAKGPTPTRPVRISDDLWNPVVAIAEAEGITASEVLRQAIAADPRVVARVAAVA